MCVSDTLRTSKTCIKCLTEKSREEFYRSTSKDGLRGACMKCERERARDWQKLHPESRRRSVRKWRTAHPETSRIKSREWKLRNKDKCSDMGLKYSYGISLVGYRSLLEKQGGHCAICRNGKCDTRLVVDHRHSTGTVRGLLCHNCNLLLGHCKENVRILNSAKEYLEKEN